ncbi:MAG: long-chain fatty acid--CoA ligase [Verrucomicrobia bacterium]|nr:long-chain fatty acid--CoA ligase [Verrucomicrobiota bacterium]
MAGVPAKGWTPNGVVVSIAPIKTPYEHDNLHAALAATVARAPGKVAVTWGDEAFTYARVAAQALALAAKLRAEFGVRAGDRVAVWVKNCPQFPSAVFGVWQAGGAVVMVSNFLKPDEVAYILGDSGANVVLSDHSLAEPQAKLRALRPELRFAFIEDFSDEAPADFSPATQTKADLAALLYTSGTTGRPKGAMLTHGNFLHNVTSCLTALDVHETDRIVVLLPQFHSFMFTVGTLLPLLAGAGVLLLKTLHPFKHVLEEIARHGGTLLPAVPSFYRTVCAVPEFGKLPLRLCISGGAPLPLEVFKEFTAKFSFRLREGYGPTESSPVATVNPIFGENRPGSVGVAIPNVELSIRDEAGGELPIGAKGELCIRGGNVMRGYWNQPEETAKTIRDGWLYTGDVGHRDADGYFFITDRKKDMLLVNGLNVYPREVEEVIHQFPGIKEAAVIGVPDARRGEAPVAFVALTEGAALAEKELLHFLRERLADYKVPRQVNVLPALPRNATGKILKTSLREMVKG